MTEDQTPPQETDPQPNMNAGPLAMIGGLPGAISLVQDFLKSTEENHATVMRALADIMARVRAIEKMLKEGGR